MTVRSLSLSHLIVLFPHILRSVPVQVMWTGRYRQGHGSASDVGRPLVHPRSPSTRQCVEQHMPMCCLVGEHQRRSQRTDQPRPFFGWTQLCSTVSNTRANVAASHYQVPLNVINADVPFGPVRPESASPAAPTSAPSPCVPQGRTRHIMTVVVNNFINTSSFTSLRALQATGKRS